MAQIIGCPMRVFWPRAARTWAVTRRPAEQCGCASLWQLFKASNDSAVLRSSLAQGCAAQLFLLYRLAAAKQHSPRPHSSSCTSQPQRTAVFSSALLFGPKPVLTAPVVGAETASNQQQSPWRTPRRRPQPLRTNRTRAGSTAQTKSPKPPRGPRPEVTKGTPAPQQYRRRGSTKKGGGPLRAFLGRPKRKTVYRQTRCGRYEALGAAPSER